MLFENYYGFSLLINMDTEEVLERGENDSCMLRGIAEMTQETEMQQVVRTLRKDPTVDNINVIYKRDVGVKYAWMAIGYHQYAEGQTLAELPPNRMYVFGIIPGSEVVRLQETYGDDYEAYERALAEGRE